MRTHGLVALSFPIFGLLAAPAWAQTAPATGPITFPAAELPKHPLMAGDLALTVLSFSNDEGYMGRNFIFQLTNPTQRGVRFTLEDLAIVDADGHQTPLLLPGWSRPDGARTALRMLPASARIAPGATFVMRCLLADSLKSPVKIYYGDQLLAVVSY